MEVVPDGRFDALKLALGDGKFQIEINDRGFALRDKRTGAIIFDGSTFVQEEVMAFAPKQFDVKRKRSKSRMDGSILYDYYLLTLKPKKKE